MITSTLISILFWFISWIDVLLLKFDFMLSASIYMEVALNYLDLMVLYIRSIFPFTVSIIFNFLWNMFAVSVLFVFLAKVKSWIPFFR